MADRIGGSFPDDRAGRPPRAAGAGRPADRRGPSSGGGRDAASGSRAGSGGGPRSDSYRGRRDDQRDGDSALPLIPDSITEDQLSRDVREELGGLSLDRAITVGRFMVAAELASDAEQAYRYAQAAKRLAARIGVVREVSGIMAYKSGRWAEALTELQAGRRMTGRYDYLPLMADSERGLGRLDRALDLVHSAEAKRLPRAAQIELRIVESGIRRDQGLDDAAVLALQVPELTDGKQRPWSARLFYAYGEALLGAGRTEAAREAFSRAVVADEDEQTDALARLDELDGITVSDLEDDEDDEDLDETDDLDGESDDDLNDEDDDDLDGEADSDLDDEDADDKSDGNGESDEDDEDGAGKPDVGLDGESDEDLDDKDEDEGDLDAADLVKDLDSEQQADVGDEPVADPAGTAKASAAGE
jgi:tetratricopeptide (TPR) repeat protein